MCLSRADRPIKPTDRTSYVVLRAKLFHRIVLGVRSHRRRYRTEFFSSSSPAFTSPGPGKLKPYINRAARLRKGGLKVLHVGSGDDAAATRDSAVVGVRFRLHVGLLRGARTRSHNVQHVDGDGQTARRGAFRHR